MFFNIAGQQFPPLNPASGVAGFKKFQHIPLAQDTRFVAISSIS
jgi:hypothetical protein